LDSPSYEEDLAGSAEEENKVNTSEEGYITREEKSTRKEDNTEDEMANNAGIYGRISQTIMGMPDNEIGDFIQSNATYSTDIILKMRTIRDRNQDNNFHQILSEMSELMEDRSFLKAYRNLRKIYEFILHMLDIYDVPIDPTVPADDDRRLRTTMKKAAGKKIRYIQKPKYAILTPVQCTTVM
jgi:hypothetical protein